MNELENLKDELLRVVEVANNFNVHHTNIALENGISLEYSRQIRKREKPSKNNIVNRDLLQGLISTYRREIRNKQTILNSINTNV